MLTRKVAGLLKTLVVLGILLIPGAKLFAQIHQPDTIDFIEKLIDRNDTLVRQRKWPLNFNESFDSFLFRNSNSRIKKELYNLIVKGSGDTGKKTPTSNVAMAAADGKIIRDIQFKNLDLFAPSITDTLYKAKTMLGRAANIAHSDTRKMILRRYLLFDPGNTLDVFEIAENERILRDLPFIMDARFLPLRVKGTRDSVDLLLLTQDKLPLGIEFSMLNSEVTLGASYQNVLGFGHSLMVTSFWNTQHVPRLGYSFAYGAGNIARTFISGKLEYLKKWNQESFMVDFTRNFRTMAIKNAGGVSYERTSLIRDVELLDTTLTDVDLNYSNVDFWMGHLFPVSYNRESMRAGIFLSGRVNQYENQNAPGTNDAYLFSYRDRSMALFSAGMTRQGFRKDNMIYTYGRTEDVPYGYLFDVTGGFEWDNYNTRPYISAGAAYGTYLKNTSYLLAQIRFGTFLHHGPKEGAFQIQMKYFSALYYYNRFQYRNFINISYIHGINRRFGEYTTLANQGGLTGLSSPLMKGNEKVVVNLESVLFSPYVFLGFRMAFFGEIDFGIVKRAESSIVNTRAFSVLSAGIRIRNERLVFDTFVLKFSLYPGKPQDATGSNFVLGTLPRARFNDFFPVKPDILPY